MVTWSGEHNLNQTPWHDITSFPETLTSPPIGRNVLSSTMMSTETSPESRRSSIMSKKSDVAEIAENVMKGAGAVMSGLSNFLNPVPVQRKQEKPAGPGTKYPHKTKYLMF